MKRLGILFLLLCGALLWCHSTMINMPGKSFRGDLPAMTAEQLSLAKELRADVETLAVEIGLRNVLNPKGLNAAADSIESRLVDAGFVVRRQTYEVFHIPCSNLEVEIKGTTHADEVVVIGAHYDSCDESPAANDNGSGVAATLALARQYIKRAPSPRTIRFVFFVNEEPPFFMSEDMGSLVYARRCREKNEKIVGMISLETIGYYSDVPGSQIYPIKPIGWLYPDAGNFIAFVGNYDSRRLVRQSIQSFRRHAQFPSEGAALPGWIEGVGWSDHWSFWQAGYPALMVTDTALYRYPYYHKAGDTPEKLDFERMARVVAGMDAVLADLAKGE